MIIKYFFGGSDHFMAEANNKIKLTKSAIVKVRLMNLVTSFYN